MNKKELTTLMTKLEAEKKLPLIEVHMLVPTGPSLLNRDIDGRIKTVTYGGVPRVRVSSPAWQRPIRQAEYTDNAVRSKYLPQVAAKKLEAMGKDETYANAAARFLEESKDGKTKGQGTAQILAFSDHDVDEIVNLIVADMTDAKDFSDAKKKTDLNKKLVANAAERAIDDTTCLMGRMSTETRLLISVEAARHANHLYSIDAWYGDSNTYTATDDLRADLKELDFMEFLKSEDDKEISTEGAGYIDESDIAANVLYGYTSISTRTLLENKLRNIAADDTQAIETAIKEARAITKRYITDYLTIRPVAKQSMNATTALPLAVVITAGTRVCPTTADSVFEKVVRATDSKSVGDIGVERLAQFVSSITEGIFKVNDYQKLVWLSDLYQENGPKQCEVATPATYTLDAIVNMIG